MRSLKVLIFIRREEAGLRAQFVTSQTVLQPVLVRHSANARVTRKLEAFRAHTHKHTHTL